MSEKSFVCQNCGQKVSTKAIGTKNRNHCPVCLWSLHLDQEIPGDRKSTCKGLMKPIDLTFKKEKINKYHKEDESGEIMLVHQCQKCQKITKNRPAGDDNTAALLLICPEKDKKEVQKQLFGVVSQPMFETGLA